MEPLLTPSQASPQAPLPPGGTAAGLGEARVLYLEGEFERSVERARAAVKETPWLHEARMQEAFGLAAMGAARQQRGGLRGARSLYREASLAGQGQEPEPELRRAERLLAPPGSGRSATGW